MPAIKSDLRKRLAYILYLGFTEVRSLARLPEFGQQVHDLADAMEVIPKFLEEATEQDLELIRFVLRDYQSRYPTMKFDYLAYLDSRDPPERY